MSNARFDAGRTEAAAPPPSYLLRAHQLLLLEELRVLMLIDLSRWYLLRMTTCSRTRSTRLRHATGGSGRRCCRCCSLPQALLGEVDGLRLRDRAVRIGLIGCGSSLILRLLLVEVHALLRRH